MKNLIISQILLTLTLLISFPALGMKKPTSFKSSKKQGALLILQQAQLHAQLLKAAEKGNLSLLKKLMQEPGIHINIADSQGNTALHKATKHAHLLCASVLIRAGAQLHTQNKDGDTPLHIAFREDLVDAITLGDKIGIGVLLLQAGANLTITNKYGVIACEHTNYMVQTYIYQPLWSAIKQKNNTLVDRFLRQGAIPAKSFMDLAIKNQNYAAIPMLIDSCTYPPLLSTSYYFGNFDSASGDLLIITHVSKKRIRETWNSRALPFLLICKRLQITNKDILRMLCLHYIKATLLEDQRTLAQKVCSQVEFEHPDEVTDELKRKFDPQCVDQYYLTWQEQIIKAIQNRPKPALVP